MTSFYRNRRVISWACSGMSSVLSQLMVKMRIHCAVISPEPAHNRARQRTVVKPVWPAPAVEAPKPQIPPPLVPARIQAAHVLLADTTRRQIELVRGRHQAGK